MTEASRADFVLVWDPDVVTAEEYAKLVAAIGDVVRECGGIGIEIIDSTEVGVRTNAD